MEIEKTIPSAEEHQLMGNQTEKNIDPVYGRRLKEIRKNLPTSRLGVSDVGVSQADLARRLGKVNGQGYISQMENGSAPMTRNTRDALILRFDVNPDFIDHGIKPIFKKSPNAPTTEQIMLRLDKRETGNIGYVLPEEIGLFLSKGYARYFFSPLHTGKLIVLPLLAPFKSYPVGSLLYCVDITSNMLAKGQPVIMTTADELFVGYYEGITADYEYRLSDPSRADILLPVDSVLRFLFIKRVDTPAV